MGEDTGVLVQGSSLDGKTVILAVSGGIAATESIKLARELRRHGATVLPMMSKSAEKIISPLALSWGSVYFVNFDCAGCGVVRIF